MNLGRIFESKSTITVPTIIATNNNIGTRYTIQMSFGVQKQYKINKNVTYYKKK